LKKVIVSVTKDLDKQLANYLAAKHKRGKNKAGSDSLETPK